MKLYLIQHAESKNKEQDPARPLSDKGKKTIKKVSEYCAELGISVSEIAHSNKLRARETAEFLAESFGAADKINEYEGLEPNDDVLAIQRILLEGEEDMAIVGHLPFLNKLASLLLSGSQDTNIVSFKMGGVVCLNKDENKDWTIEWMLAPEIVK